MGKNIYFLGTISGLGCIRERMRQVRTRGKDVHFSSCRPEADQDGAVDRNRRSLTARAVGGRYRRSFSALLGRSDLDRCGAARSAIARIRCLNAAKTRAPSRLLSRRTA